MRRILDALLPIIFIFLLCFFCVWIEDPELVEEWFYEINPWDYARITDVDYKAVVVDEPGNSGKVLVTERLTFDVHAFSKDNLFWELWRDLCEDNVDGLKVDYKVNSVKQILPDGSEVIYEESPKLYWDDYDYVSSNTTYGPGKWYHSPGPYSEYFKQYECVFFYVDGLYRDEVVFEIEYEMNNASLRYGDCSELYLPLFSEDSVNYLESFKAEILFPIEDMPSKGNYYYHTYGTKNLKFPVTESATKNPGYYTFSFDLDEDDLKFNPHTEYIEFDFISFGEDKHAFTNFAPRNNYYYDDGVLKELYAEHDEFIEGYEEAKANKEKGFMVCTVIALLVVFYTLGTKGRMHRKYTYYKPTTDLIYYRDIPSNLDPNFAANLVFCKDFKQSKEEDRYSAILLSLVRKKYIELEKVSSWADWEPFNTKIIIKHKPTPPQAIHSFDEVITTIHDYTNVLVADENSTNSLDDEMDKLEPLTKTEEYYFNLLVRHVSFNNEILLGTFQSKITNDYVNTDAFVTNVENSVGIIGATDGYFQKFDFSQPKKQVIGVAKFFTLTGLLLLTVVNLISYQTTLDFAFGGFSLLGITFLLCALYLAKTAGKYTLLTQFGEDEYQKWRGLYDFLNNNTLMSERTVIELPLWEQYLVYATAFGISEKVIAALKIRCPELPDLPANHMLNNNSYSRSHRIRHNSRSFRSSTRSASRSARSHGYGGYSGGRGGGGGGGGH